MGMYVAGSSFFASFSFADGPVTLPALASFIAPATAHHAFLEIVYLCSSMVPAALILAGALKKFCFCVIVQVSAAALRTI
jgi:hypothetical protein